MSDIFKKVERFVVESFTKTGQTQQIKHFLRTVYWVKELDPDVTDALLTAAVSHDIERAFRGDDQEQRRKSLSFSDLDFLRPHEERGAEIIAEFLRDNNADNQLIEEVKSLVSRHEEGGNESQNMLKDADSVSFFENNVSSFLTKQVSEVGKEKVKQKFDWMFERITSQKAKKFARQFYIDALKGL